MVDDAEAAEEDEEDDEAAGYRIKNKNPAQRCGGKKWKKHTHIYNIHIFTYIHNIYIYILYIKYK